MRFIEFLLEAEPVDNDIEDLSPEDLKKRRQGLQKLERLKASGQDTQAKALSMKALNQEIQATKNSKKKGDLIRRRNELKTAPDEEEVAPV